MENLEELYNSLKEFDQENKLTYYPGRWENNTIIKLVPDQETEIVVFDNYLEVFVRGKSQYSFHPSYQEIYDYLLNVMTCENLYDIKRRMIRGRRQQLINYFTSVFCLFFILFVTDNIWLMVGLFICYQIIYWLIMYIYNKKQDKNDLQFNKDDYSDKLWR